MPPTPACPFDFVNGILRKNYTLFHFPANLLATATAPDIIKTVKTPSQLSLSNFLASRGCSALPRAGSPPLGFNTSPAGASTALSQGKQGRRD